MKLYKTIFLTLCWGYCTTLHLSAQQSNSKIVYPRLTPQTKVVTVESSSSSSFFPRFTEFSDGVAWVQNGKTQKWALIDTSGNILIDFVLSFGYDAPPTFHQGICPFMIPGKGYVLINKTGQIVVKLPETTKISPYIDGVATAFLKVKNNKKSTSLRPYYDIKAVYLNTKGQVIWANLASDIQAFDVLKPMRPFKESLAAFYDYAKRKWGYINKEGKIVIPAVAEEAKDFSEGLAAVKINGKWGYINTKGVVTINNIFTEKPESFSCGRAIVYKNQGGNNVCFIDTLGKVRTSDLFSAISYIKGRAFVSPTQFETIIMDTNNKVLRKLDKFGELKNYNDPTIFEKEGIIYKSDGKPSLRIIDSNGNTLMGELTGTFNDGLASFTHEVHDPYKNVDFIFGFTDRDGNAIIQFKRNEF